MRAWRCIPPDLISNIGGAEGANKLTRLPRVTRLSKISRLTRLTRVTKLVKLMTNFGGSRLVLQVFGRSRLLVVLKFALTLSLMTHVCACLWCHKAENEGERFGCSFSRLPHVWFRMAFWLFRGGRRRELGGTS